MRNRLAAYYFTIKTESLKDSKSKVSIFLRKLKANRCIEYDIGNDQNIQKYGTITRPEAEELLGISASTASRLIRKMVKTGLLLQDGRARNSRYIPAE